MSIEWNKVTWYSKLGAVITIVIAVSLGLYFWSEYQKIRELNNAVPMIQNQTTTPISSTQEAPLASTEIITGQVIHVSDVATIPDFPETEGGISIISFDKFEPFMLEVADHWGIDFEYDEEVLPHFQTGVPQELAEEYILASPQLDTLGQFSTKLGPGSYILCLTNIRKPSPNEAPIIFYGCGKVELQEGQTLNLDASFGEAGFRFQVQPSAEETTEVAEENGNVVETGEDSATFSGISVTTDKQTYGENEDIVVTITNKTDSEITTFNQRTSCTIAVLERYNGIEWDEIRNCYSGVPSRNITLDSHSETVVRMSAMLDSWTPGDYRALVLLSHGSTFNFGNAVAVDSLQFGVR